MGRKRRHIGISEPEAWISNRMADVYDARPPYPHDLVEAIARLAPGPRVADLGAGTGHLSLPLAHRGLDVVAVEPAVKMLEVLRASATARGLRVATLHARAEELPFEAARFDVVVIADSLHFLDVELTAAQVRRVLAPRGQLVIVHCELAATPFMMSVRQLMEQTAPRRPRSTEQAVRQLASLARVQLDQLSRFGDMTPVAPDRLEQILRSVSFIGPALNPERFAAFQSALHGLSANPVWARSFTLQSGRRTRAT